MTMTYQQLSELNNSLHNELAEVYEALAQKEHEVLMLSQTVDALKIDSISVNQQHNLKIKLIEGRLLQ